MDGIHLVLFFELIIVKSIRKNVYAWVSGRLSCMISLIHREDDGNMLDTDRPLALTGEAYSEEKSWKKHRELITSLPYLDTLGDEEKAIVRGLIEEELKNSDKKPEDYLSELPDLPQSRLESDALLQAELARVGRGEELEALDLTRYNLEAPSGSQKNDLEAWRKALDNAYSQREHQYTRLLNLELMLKYAAQAYRASNEELSEHVDRLQKTLDEIRSTIEQTNAERKLQQVAAGRELNDLQNEYWALLQKNKELDLACRLGDAELEQHTKSLERIEDKTES